MYVVFLLFELEKRKAPGGTIKTITKEALSSFKLSLPSLLEQQKIASFLSSVDEWIENLREQKKHIEKYKKGMMQKIFSQEVRFKDENGNVFPDWEEKSLGEITYNFDNIRKPVSAELRESGNFPYYGANGVVDYVKDYIFDGEYILVAEDGVVDVTKYPVHFVWGRFWANNHAHVLQGKAISNKFLFYCLLNTRFARYITGSAQTKLNGQVLNKIRLNIPASFLEQKKIAEFLTYIDQQTEAKESQIKKAEEWKKGLLQKIFI